MLVEVLVAVLVGVCVFVCVFVGVGVDVGVGQIAVPFKYSLQVVQSSNNL